MNFDGLCVGIISWMFFFNYYYSFMEGNDLSRRDIY